MHPSHTSQQKYLPISALLSTEGMRLSALIPALLYGSTRRGAQVQLQLCTIFSHQYLWQNHPILFQFHQKFILMFLGDKKNRDQINIRNYQ